MPRAALSWPNCRKKLPPIALCGAAMSLSLLLALQAATPMLTDRQLQDFDLKEFERAAEAGPGPGARRRCASDDPNQIIVCGSRGQGQRLEPLPDIYEKGPIMAETRLFGRVTGCVCLEKATMPGGAVSNRIVVGLKMPF